jgi:hypothetical protein
MKTCKITFRTSKNIRFIKGNDYTILPQAGLKGIKIFKIYHTNGHSFSTDEQHVNKFFAN